MHELYTMNVLLVDLMIERTKIKQLCTPSLVNMFVLHVDCIFVKMREYLHIQSGVSTIFLSKFA